MEAAKPAKPGAPTGAKPGASPAGSPAAATISPATAAPAAGSAGAPNPGNAALAAAVAAAKAAQMNQQAGKAPAPAGGQAPAAPAASGAAPAAPIQGSPQANPLGGDAGDLGHALAKMEQGGVPAEYSGPIMREDALLSCLVILTRIFGNPKSPAALAAGLPIAGEGMTPDLFLRAADRAGLSANRIKRKIDQVSAMGVPAVLLLKDRKAVEIGRAHV